MSMAQPTFGLNCNSPAPRRRSSPLHAEKNAGGKQAGATVAVISTADSPDCCNAKLNSNTPMQHRSSRWLFPTNNSLNYLVWIHV